MCKIYPCLLSCLSFCGCRTKIFSHYTFFPPKDSRYFFKKDDSNPGQYNVEFVDNIAEFVPESIKYELLFLTKFNKKQIPCFYITCTEALTNQIIIFSHGNSTDIGRMFESYIDIAYNLKINIFAYEYDGYPHTKDKATDYNLLDDIYLAYQYIRNELKYPFTNIILYGQSIGSGPSTYLASNYLTPVGGLILHSPIASGIKIVDFNIEDVLFTDMFPNMEMIKYVKCPIYIFQGLNDRAVDVSHGKLLYEKSSKLYPA